MSSFLLVLAVVQDVEVRALAKSICERSGHRLIECDSYRQGRALLSNGLSPDVLLAGAPAPGTIEAEHFREFLTSASIDKVCVLTGPGGDSLSRLADGRSIDHVLKTPVLRSELESAIDKISRKNGNEASGETRPARAGAAPLGVPEDMPGLPFIEELGEGRFFLAASPRMLEIHRQIKLLAATDVNVLILGESGTGKEVIAQLIHRNSSRARGKFLKVNCAALPAELLESELFGHRQGAFTGAIKDHPGKFEQADEGTLLLDEIGEIGIQIQAKLLHVLQDGQFTRLGGQSCTKVDVRVLAATNLQMEDALLEKTFREDLYYRLSVFTLHVPPLRERREEIPYLIEETIRRAPDAMRKGMGIRMPSRLLDAALVYEWPGNLRELHNFITRTIILRDLDGAMRELESRIEGRRRSSPSAISAAGQVNGPGMRSVVRDVKDRTEMQMIQDALEASRWNRRQAAQFLNISYRALLYKIQQHRLIPKASRNVSDAPIID